jgi:pyridoxamine 5'-phosphate oxidase
MSRQAPRWYIALEQAVTQNEKTSCAFSYRPPAHSRLSRDLIDLPYLSVYQLATIDEVGKPHVRSHIHRAFLVPPSNPALPLLVTSTDIRTPKIDQILGSQANTVELAWWIDATSDQFRISGPARIFAAPECSISMPLRAAPDCAGIEAVEASGMDWEAKRRELFDAVSQRMRATWCRPAPGSPLQGGYEEMNDWPLEVPKPSEAKTEKERELAELALSNYALIVIEPLYVDWVQMAIKPNRRTFFTREGSEWKEDPVVP